MQMAPRAVVALVAASVAIQSDATAVNSTETTSTLTSSTKTFTVFTFTSAAPSSATGTSTDTRTATSNTDTSTKTLTPHTETYTTSILSSTATSSATATPFVCLGDADTFDGGYGNCSTYAPEENHNFNFCNDDFDSDGLFAEQACPECGLCYLNVSTTTGTTSPLSTTDTSTGTSSATTASTSASTTQTSNTETSTETLTSHTQTYTTSVLSSTATSSVTAGPVACLGDADTFDAGYGNCSTYAPEEHFNFNYCDNDFDSDGLLPEQVCPECGLCYLNVSTTTGTTSAHSTTDTSTGTSSTSLHTTTDTSSSTTPHTTTETTTSTLVACLGDADNFDVGFGNCSTYAPGAPAEDFNFEYFNFAFCDFDEDDDGLLAQQICQECGLCRRVTSTTAHTTTETSTDTSTTGLHTTADTSGTTTPHTTTETHTTTYTEGPCSRAISAVSRAIDFPAGECTDARESCPTACRTVLEDAIVVCHGDNDTDSTFHPFRAGSLVSTVLTYSWGACHESYIDALVNSTAYAPTCLDGLYLLSLPILLCTDDTLSACPDVCERMMDVVLDRCSATDAIRFGNISLTAGRLVEAFQGAASQQCSGILGTKAFPAADETSTAMADDITAEEEWASTTVHHGTGYTSSSLAGTIPSDTTIQMSSSSITPITGSSSTTGVRSVAEEEDDSMSSSSYRSAAGLVVLSFASYLFFM